MKALVTSDDIRMIRHISQGMTDREMSEQVFLELTEKQISNAILGIRKRFKAKSRAHLIAIGIEQGII